MILIGEWIDYLKENDVYDNTRIILVSDHGRDLNQFDELLYDDVDLQSYAPLLMVKDFNADDDYTESDEFMTNADVPTIAMADLIENPVNPFTGNIINSDDKYSHDQYLIVSSEWQTTVNNGNTFMPAKWVSVKDGIWTGENIEVYDKEVVLKEHSFDQLQ